MSRKNLTKIILKSTIYKDDKRRNDALYQITGASFAHELPFDVQYNKNKAGYSAALWALDFRNKENTKIIYL